jgi:hypothetical protein
MNERIVPHGVVTGQQEINGSHFVNLVHRVNEFRIFCVFAYTTRRDIVSDGLEVPVCQYAMLSISRDFDRSHLLAHNTSIDSEDASRNNKFEFDTQTQGPMIGLTTRS